MVVMASEEEVGQVPIVQNGEGVNVLGGPMHKLYRKNYQSFTLQRYIQRYDRSNLLILNST